MQDVKVIGLMVLALAVGWLMLGQAGKTMGYDKAIGMAADNAHAMGTPSSAAAKLGVQREYEQQKAGLAPPNPEDYEIEPRDPERVDESYDADL